MYGTDNASEVALEDVSVEDDSTILGLASSTSDSVVNSNETLWVVLAVVGVSILTLILFLIFSKKARYKTARFFSEMFAGIFGKKKTN